MFLLMITYKICLFNKTFELYDKTTGKSETFRWLVALYRFVLVVALAAGKDCVSGEYQPFHIRV